MSEVKKEALNLSATGEGKGAPLGAIPTNPNPISNEIIEQNEKDIPSTDIFGGGEVVAEEEITKEVVEAGVVEETTTEPVSEEAREEVVEEEVTEEGPTPEGEEDEVNYYYYMAQQLAKDGELPEGFEVTEDISPEDIYSTYKETIREDATSEVQNEVLESLAAQGFNAGDLQYAKLLRSGVDPRTLQTAARYENLASIDLETADEDAQKKVITAMYEDRGMGDEEVSAIIEKAELDDNLTAFAEKSKIHFTKKHTEIVEKEQATAKQREAQQAQIQQAKLAKIQGVLKEGKVLEETIPDVKAFQRALYDKTETVDIGGQKYTASPFQLFQFQYENNPEIQLWAFKQMLYRGENQSKLKKEVTAEVEKEYFTALKEDFKTKSSKNSKIKQKLEQTPMWS